MGIKLHDNFASAEIERDQLIKDTGEIYIIHEIESGHFECRKAVTPEINEAVIELHPSNKIILSYFFPLSAGLLIFFNAENLTVALITAINNTGILSFINQIHGGFELIGIMLFAMYFIKCLYRIYSQKYIIDSEGIRVHDGIWAKDIKVIKYKDIQTPTLRRSLSDRFLKTGSLEFSASGTGSIDMRFDQIDSPNEVLELILENSNKT
ncbi:MAG: PH domain-containing protein [Kofleriaceae bacterium]|nr:PH domain-containing protein [Kofleriaceae bacterium]